MTTAEPHPPSPSEPLALGATHAPRRQVEAAFAFEREKLNVNDLRILIANDLFRMQHRHELQHS